MKGTLKKILCLIMTFTMILPTMPSLQAKATDNELGQKEFVCATNFYEDWDDDGYKGITIDGEELVWNNPIVYADLNGANVYFGGKSEDNIEKFR
ncbi:MAG: hypothetical protein Q4D51_03770 [Eubacteriales bacterium]|nr:hypothetical protein [Eubacteriales bacterium]